MFGFLSGKSLRNEARAMVGAFAQDCPPPSKVGSKQIPEKKVGESLNALYLQVAACARNNNLGILGRARLAKALQNEMQQRKYPEELVNRMVNAVTMNALVAPDRR